MAFPLQPPASATPVSKPSRLMAYALGAPRPLLSVKNASHKELPLYARMELDFLKRQAMEDREKEIYAEEIQQVRKLDKRSVSQQDLREHMKSIKEFKHKRKLFEQDKNIGNNEGVEGK